MTSGGNNFNDFPENRPIVEFALLCKPTWWNATVSPFPFDLISFGGTAFLPKNIWGTAFPPAFPLDYATVVCTLRAMQFIPRRHLKTFLFQRSFSDVIVTL